MGQPNPFDTDPAALAQLEGAYTAMRDQVLAVAKPFAHSLLRTGAPRTFYEIYTTTAKSGVHYLALAQGYACALIEVARLRNQIDGVALDPMPEWPADDDPREQARKRVAAFTDALMRLCMDHQILIHPGEAPMPWLEDMAADEGTRLASNFHWCTTVHAYAAAEPVDQPGYADELASGAIAVPWEVPDDHH